MSLLVNPQDFFIPEFVEKATIDSKSYTCIQSELSGEENYTNYGQEDGATLYLDFIITDLTKIPVAGDKITFRSKIYKTIKATEDSANLTVKVGLVALSGGK